MKVGASVVSARRGGLSATFDELNKYFTISGMPVASGQYWNSIHGNNADEAQQDLEGLQIMRTLARNMSFSDEEHPARKRILWSSGKGTAHRHKLYPLIYLLSKMPSFRLFLCLEYGIFYSWKKFYTRKSLLPQTF